jgi:hypothetical protein
VSDFLELMKQRQEERFLESLNPNAQKCSYSRETIAHAYKQGYGVMISYKDARKNAGIDVHHLPRWEMELRSVASGLATGGEKHFQIDWENALAGGNDGMLRCYPLLKGLEAMAKLLDITPNEVIERALKEFDRYRKGDASPAGICVIDDSVLSHSKSRRTTTGRRPRELNGPSR